MKKYIQRTLLLVGGATLAVLCYGLVTAPHSARDRQSVLQVVAAENFWGNLVSQIGGSHVHVTSLVTDPNADPHEYSSSIITAQTVATADYVIENGAGYDGWMDKLVSASHNDNQKMLTIAGLLGKKDGDNPHFWYSPIYVNQVIKEMVRNLSQLDPANTQYYQTQYNILQNRLDAYQAQIAQMKRQYGGVKVAATEDIFVYLANAAGLDLISPLSFTQAVAEGNDPPTDSVVTFQQQLKDGTVKLLVFNNQTETPLTDEMKTIARSEHIPIVGITETLQPVGSGFQDWMASEMSAINGALSRSAAR